MSYNESLRNKLGELWEQCGSLEDDPDSEDFYDGYEEYWRNLHSVLRTNHLVLNTKKRRRFDRFFMDCYLNLIVPADAVTKGLVKKVVVKSKSV